MDREFSPLALHHVAQQKSLNDFHNYVDGLALMDDLLCKYDRKPRLPTYLPLDNGGRSAGDLELITEGVSQCLSALESADLKESLVGNFQRAKALYSDADDATEEISDFLAALLHHYSQIIHPAVYPEGRD